jgi:hypothetical protein
MSCLRYEAEFDTVGCHCGPAYPYALCDFSFTQPLKNSHFHVLITSESGHYQHPLNFAQLPISPARLTTDTTAHGLTQ